MNFVKRPDTFILLCSFCSCIISIILCTIISYPTSIQADSTNNVIKAQKIEIIDKNGQIRAVFGIGDDDNTYFALFDNNHNTRFGVGTSGKDTVMSLSGSSKHPVFIWGVVQNEASMQIKDEEYIRAFIGAANNGDSFLTLYNKKGKCLFKAP